MEKPAEERQGTGNAGEDNWGGPNGPGGLPSPPADTDESETESLAFVLQRLEAAINDLQVRVLRLETRYQSDGIGSVGQGDPDPQEVEATIAFWLGEEALITGVMKRQLSEPVDGGDRHNLAKVVLGLLQRLNRLEFQADKWRREESSS
jgi:hypothetical protein